MQINLEKKSGQRLRFRAVARKFGYWPLWEFFQREHVWLEEIVCLRDGTPIASQILKCGSRAKWAASLRTNTVFEFDARISSKVCFDHEEVVLKRPNKVVIISEDPPGDAGLTKVRMEEEVPGRVAQS